MSQPPKSNKLAADAEDAKKSPAVQGGDPLANNKLSNELKDNGVHQAVIEQLCKVDGYTSLAHLTVDIVNALGPPCNAGTKAIIKDMIVKAKKIEDEQKSEDAIKKEKKALLPVPTLAVGIVTALPGVFAPLPSLAPTAVEPGGALTAEAQKALNLSVLTAEHLLCQIVRDNRLGCGLLHNGSFFTGETANGRVLLVNNTENFRPNLELSAPGAVSMTSMTCVEQTQATFYTGMNMDASVSGIFTFVSPSVGAGYASMDEDTTTHNEFWSVCKLDCPCVELRLLHTGPNSAFLVNPELVRAAERVNDMDTFLEFTKEWGTAVPTQVVLGLGISFTRHVTEDTKLTRSAYNMKKGG